MFEKFALFKRKVTSYQIIVGIVSWSFFSLILNSFLHFVLGLDWDDTDSGLTSLFAFFSPLLCLYLAIKVSRKFKVQIYTKWLIRNFDINDNSIKKILFFYIYNKVIDHNIISVSKLSNSEKEFIYHFDHNSKDFKEAFLYINKEKVDKHPVLYVLPENYYTIHFLFVILGFPVLLLISIMYILDLLSVEFNNYSTILTIIYIIVGVASIIVLFSKRNYFITLFKSKSLLIIDKRGIRYQNTFYNWELIELPYSFIERAYKRNPQDFDVDIKFSYKGEKVGLNFHSTQIDDIYSFIAIYSDKYKY